MSVFIISVTTLILFLIVRRFKYYRDTKLSPEEMAKFGVDMKKKGTVTLETEYEKVGKIDIENWTNIRGPRPWE